MNIAKYIEHLQNEIKDKDYNDYVHAFHEYKAYLEARIKENDCDIDAVCQLAAVCFELRYSCDYSIKIMEDLLLRCNGELSIDNKARIYTNLAFFYEDDYDKENCLRCLKEAVNLNTDSPNAYDALGRLYMENGDNYNALKLFEKAYRLSGDMRYKYDYAVALFESGNIYEAKVIFEKLLISYQTERRILYGYGICCFYTGDAAKALEIADSLACDEIDDYIAESEIADLYFLCGAYEKHNKMYAEDEYYTDVKWIAPYFYGLKAQGNTNALVQKFNEVVREKDKDIAETQNEELDDDFTESDRNESIQVYQREKDDIIEAYDKIMRENYKPEIKITLWFMRGCYLIDCPRHQNVAHPGAAERPSGKQEEV